MSNAEEHDESTMTRPHLAFLCDDTLLRILSYCNLPSLVHLTRGTSKQLRNRFHPAEERDEMIDSETNNEQGQRGYCQSLWSQVFFNHNFAPDKRNHLAIDQYDYYDSIRHRLELFARLVGKRRRVGKRSSNKKKKKVKQCFSLPDRHFNFVPVVPPDMISCFLLPLYPHELSQKTFHTEFWIPNQLL